LTRARSAWEDGGMAGLPSLAATLRAGLLYAAACAAVLAGSPGHAAYVVTLYQAGDDVVAAGEGSFDLSAWSLGYSSGPPLISSSFDSIQILLGGGPGSPGEDIYLLDGTLSRPPPLDFDPLPSTDARAGDVTGLHFSAQALAVPLGYVSGAPLSGMSIWEGETLLGRGLERGTHTWTWPTPTATDSFTITVIPEPGSGVLLGVALCGLGWIGRRRSLPSPSQRTAVASTSAGRS
jgi:hypothetical protein